MPIHALGADLLWWRTSGGMRSIVSLFWNRYQPFPDPVHLQAFLFNGAGQVLTSWRIDLFPDQPVQIDSTVEGPWRAFDGRDGVLALYACTDQEPSATARKRYNRLFPMLDWLGADGYIASFHSDQVVIRGKLETQRFTEIVVLESDDEQNALIVLNGESPQAPGALELTVCNASGATRSARYALPMLPFTVHRIALRSLLPDLIAFADGAPLLVSGTFESSGLFTRPYIETTGQHRGAYHGGNVYAWTPLPYFAHALIGGELNPMAVLQDGQTRTFVNLLHSHDGHEAELRVDATLYDADGACVARRPAWRLASRHGLARADVGELIPDSAAEFTGHLALSFDPDPGQAVPCHLQALLEYRSGDGVAHVMAWSDEWNSPVRVRKQALRQSPMIHRSYYRILEGRDATTMLALTNAGHDAHGQHAGARLVLYGRQGALAETRLVLAPYATRFVSVAELFPQSIAALAPSGLGMVLVESSSDLALVAFTRHRASGALAAEHFMSLPSEHEGELGIPSGS